MFPLFDLLFAGYQHETDPNPKGNLNLVLRPLCPEIYVIYHFNVNVENVLIFPRERCIYHVVYVHINIMLDFSNCRQLRALVEVIHIPLIMVS